jgi:hypothetical protein
LAIKELCKEQAREVETMTVVLGPGGCKKERYRKLRLIQVLKFP